MKSSQIYSNTGPQPGGPVGPVVAATFEHLLGIRHLVGKHFTCYNLLLKA